MQYAAGASSPGTTEIAALDAILVRLYTGTAMGTGTAYLPNCTTSVTLIQIDYVVLDGTSMGSAIPHAATGGAGTSCPSECAPVLTLLTGKRGRRYRGRIYYPCPNTSSIDSGGSITTGLRNSTQNQYIGMIPLLSAIQWTPVVASYGVGQHTDPITKTVTRTTWTPFATPITTARMDLLMDVQRSRKTG